MCRCKYFLFNRRKIEYSKEIRKYLSPLGWRKYFSIRFKAWRILSYLRIILNEDKLVKPIHAESLGNRNWNSVKRKTSEFPLFLKRNHRIWSKNGKSITNMTFHTSDETEIFHWSYDKNISSKQSSTGLCRISCSNAKLKLQALKMLDFLAKWRTKIDQNQTLMVGC